MVNSLRKSGIPFVPSLPWGTHVCAFYSSPDDLLELLVPFFTAGLLEQEFCFWVTSNARAAKKSAEAMQNAMQNIDKGRIEKQMEIVPENGWYVTGGSVYAAKVRKAWMKKLSDAQGNGFQGLRACGEVPRLSRKVWKSFSQYEKKVDRFIAGKHILFICAYSIRQFGIDQLVEVLRYHGSVLVKLQKRWECLEISMRDIRLPTAEEYAILTARERQVMRLIALGLTNGEIASNLLISQRTVEAHRANLMRKLRLRNPADLVRFALSNTLI